MNNAVNSHTTQRRVFLSFGGRYSAPIQALEVSRESRSPQAGVRVNSFTASNISGDVACIRTSDTAAARKNSCFASRRIRRVRGRDSLRVRICCLDSGTGGVFAESPYAAKGGI